MLSDPDAVEVVRAAVVAELGQGVLVDYPPIMAGDDFSAYLSGAPGVFFIVGSGQMGAAPHHHPRFTIDESAFRNGIAVFLRAAVGYLA